MRKNVKKFLSLLLAVAIMAGCMAIPSVEAEAATKTHTLQYDNKKGVAWETTTRYSIGSTSYYSSDYSTLNDNCIDIFLEKQGDYVASVKTNNSNMKTKVVYSRYYTGNYGFVPSALSSIYPNKTWRGEAEIQFFTKKAGTYKITFTIKNKNKKTTCQKTATVYAGSYSTPIQYLSYAGLKVSYLSNNYTSTITSKKASGKLSCKAGSGYRITKIQMAKTYNKKGEPIFKTIRNNQNIKLATSTKYSVLSNTYSYGDSTRNYYNEYNYLKPKTLIRVTYYDKLLKITNTADVVIFNLNK